MAVAEGEAGVLVEAESETAVPVLGDAVSVADGVPVGLCVDTVLLLLEVAEGAEVEVLLVLLPDDATPSQTPKSA